MPRSFTLRKNPLAGAWKGLGAGVAWCRKSHPRRDSNPEPSKF